MKQFYSISYRITCPSTNSLSYFAMSLPFVYEPEFNRDNSKQKLLIQTIFSHANRWKLDCGLATVRLRYHAHFLTTCPLRHVHRNIQGLQQPPAAYQVPSGLRFVILNFF